MWLTVKALHSIPVQNKKKKEKGKKTVLVQKVGKAIREKNLKNHSDLRFYLLMLNNTGD